MPINNTTISRPTSDLSIPINTVLRKTYTLLSITLLFSGLVAYYAMINNVAMPNMIVFLIGIFGLQFLTMKLRNSKWGLLAVFAFTGFMGYTLGPILNIYLKTYINGPSIVATSLAATGVVFVGLSAYTITSRKDFSYLGGFLMVAIMGAFMASIGAMFFHIPMLQLIISSAFVLISSGFILFTTSRLINGGERNYLMATISLYVAIFNLFVSLLQIFGALSGNSRN